MGDASDNILDGTVCNVCGEIVASESGVPTNCGCDPSQPNIEKDMSEKAVHKRLEKLGWITND